MAGKTQGEKIDELLQSYSSLTERVGHVRFQVDRLDSTQAETTTDLAALTTRVAVLEHQVIDLRKASEEGGRRWWSLVPALIGGIAGSVITILGQMLLARLGK
jgi:hypothetical protein